MQRKGLMIFLNPVMSPHKSKEINNSENPLEKDYQFIKGLYQAVQLVKFYLGL